ncbi:MAG: nucleotidyl transferase AbiEii/AbiGii toxin family protein [Actinomycetota bacterium]|nr:nucleotidyl transferase AbiEii/AbiGii toxin family protein [Actinomycetota bacterium]MDQ2959101.1 nucleotidyl transferase AbiEii/AbiGii toxin family protein [Actinomycetota bacterium]
MSNPSPLVPYASIRVASTSREQDLSYLALHDLAQVGTELGHEYRVVGGTMVSLLVEVYAVTGVPPRATADADLAARFEVVSDPALPALLKARGYTQEDGSRFGRGLTTAEAEGYGDTETSGMRPAIDVLMPSYTGHHQPNQPAGELVVDAFPGLALALAHSPVQVQVNATLTTGVSYDIPVPLPPPQSALCVKLLAWIERKAPKDAVDIWRLLAVCAAAGVTPSSWKLTGAQKDACTVLKTFTIPGRGGLADASRSPGDQAQIRALALKVAPGC